MMTGENDKLFGTDITNFISAAIKKEVERRFDEIKDEFIKEIDREKDKICAGILLNVMGTINVDSMRNQVTITIKKIEK